MEAVQRVCRILTAVGIGLVAASCGGGGGGTTPRGPLSDPTWTAGQYSAPAAFAARCAAPRVGVDPSGAPWPDQPGSIVWENSWLRSWTNAYYLWYREVPDLNPALTPTTAQYFGLMKTIGLTPSGTPKDRFHFALATDRWLAFVNNGVTVGYGAAFAVVTPPGGPRQVLIAYIDPGTPAAMQNLARGAAITAVDGVAATATDAASVATLNAGLSPTTSGQTHSFTVVDTPGAASRSILMTSINVTSTPVQNVRVLPAAGGSVGYLTFNDHIASAESALIAAFGSLQQSRVTDLVLDLRYNGGGLLDIASEVAYMVAGPARTANQTFELYRFNDKYQTTNPITGQPITPAPFQGSATGYGSAVAGQPLPHLDLARLFVLTGKNTCSASESIINGLTGVGIAVIEVGAQTCGKPYAFYPQDNCGTTYFSIQLQGVNARGFGDYGDGFVPSNSASSTGVRLPGCAVADDFGHALGDPAEARLAAALSYQQGSACPAASAVGGTPGVEPQVMKSQLLMNRILRPR